MSGLDTTGAACPANAAFSTTHWSVVLAARQKTSEEATAAMERLCRAYWRPLYAFVRRRGYDAPDAQDLTQEFFARFLEKDFLQSVDRSKGKFRSFLLAALEHFLAKEWRRAHTQKRGGKLSFISFEAPDPEEQYLQVPSAGMTPEQLFDQQWALALLDQSLARLQQEYVAEGKSELFATTKSFLTGEGCTNSYANLATNLGTTEAALKMSAVCAGGLASCCGLKLRERSAVRRKSKRNCGCSLAHWAAEREWVNFCCYFPSDLGLESTGSTESCHRMRHARSAGSSCLSMRHKGCVRAA